MLDNLQARPRIRGVVVLLALIGLVTALGSARSAAVGEPSGSEHSQYRCHGKQPTIFGTKKADNLRGTKGRDVIAGFDGNDKIRGLGGNDIICGGRGADTLIGGRGNDRLYGQQDGFGEDYGDWFTGDRLSGGPGNDVMVGGGKRGADRVTYHGSKRSVRVNLPRGTASGQGQDRLRGIKVAIGSRYDDKITVGGDHASGVGAAGNDTLRITSGPKNRTEGTAEKPWTSYLWGGRGRDRLVGSAGNDYLFGDSGKDVVVGRRGDDVIGWAHETSDDLLRGGPGADILRNGKGDARIVGGRGADTLFGGPGNDALLGGPGSDTVSYGRPYPSVLDHPVKVNLNRGRADAGEYGRHRLTGIENIRGSSHRDTLIGDDGSNRIRGGDGRDLVKGLGGNDSLDGGPGRDRGNGGAGTDTCKRFETMTACEN